MKVLTRRSFFVFSVVMGICLLSGCNVLTPVKSQPMARYTISDWHQSTRHQLRKPRSKNTILVTTPIAASGYTTNKMIYVTVPFKLKAFANHEWVAPPAKLLQPLLVNQLEKTRYFYAVVTSPFSGRTHYQLNTRLLMLQQEFLKPESDVHLMMQAILLNTKTSRVIATRLFDLTVPAPENNPYSGVLATNKAALSLTKKISRFVLQTLRTRH